MHHLQLSYGFNTQPPEGGCDLDEFLSNTYEWFQHTAARRRLQMLPVIVIKRAFVSTHSRPKAAAPRIKKLRRG